MKTLNCLVFFVINLIIAYTTFSNTPPDSCLKIFNLTEDSTYENPHEVKVDSCEGSSTFLQYYRKKYFKADFHYNIIPREGVFSEDTIIEFTVDDIDSKYTVAISEFESLEDELRNN